jgi:hypothetical protein
VVVMVKRVNGGLDQHTTSLAFALWGLAWAVEVAYVRHPSPNLVNVEILDVQVHHAAWLDTHVALTRSEIDLLIRSQANEHVSLKHATHFHLSRSLT